MAGWWVMCPSSIGTWVRFPGPPLYSILFCSIYFHAVLHQGITMQPQISACHAPKNSNPKARMDSPPWTPVNTSTRKSEKSNKAWILGPNYCKSNSSIWVNTPYVCISFSLFFSFIYSFLINCVPLIHQIMFKIQKKIRKS